MNLTRSRVEKAIKENKLVTLVYGGKRRWIRPTEIKTDAKGWYIYAEELPEGEVKSFRFDRSIELSKYAEETWEEIATLDRPSIKRWTIPLFFTVEAANIDYARKIVNALLDDVNKPSNIISITVGTGEQARDEKR